uniref:Uncharacterized protein n=1 Tax=Cucumis melo TaxID=3656 RepID=A0A9I9EGJ3_CUCME
MGRKEIVGWGGKIKSKTKHRKEKRNKLRNWGRGIRIEKGGKGKNWRERSGKSEEIAERENRKTTN